MATVQNVYDIVCTDFAEPGGLILGIVTPDQFIDIFNQTLTDFLTQTGLVKRWWTMTIEAGMVEIPYPDDLMHVDAALIAGRWLDVTDALHRHNLVKGQRRSLPEAYYLDGLQPNIIGLDPAPGYNGSFIPGANEPDPPHGQYDAFTLAAVDPRTLTMSVQNPEQHRGLTMVTSVRSATPISGFSDTIPMLPDGWEVYLAFGVEERVFSSDNELKDKDRSAWCKAQYLEGVALAQTVSGYLSGEDQQ